MKTFTNEEISIFNNIFSFSEEREDGCVHRIKFPVKNQLSNRVTNLASLADINQTKAFKAYYFEHNVNAAKQYFYLAAKLRAETCKYSTGWDMASINPFIFALLSDSREMIDIYSHLDTKNNSIFRPEQRPPLRESYHLPKDARFPVLVFQHVLQKDWTTVDKMFGIYQEKRKKKVSIDMDNFNFYFALRDGDTEKMKELISKYLQPRVHKGMNKNLVSEHEGCFWSHIPTRFSKLAALHGYELDIKSDLIPEYLIPVEPLEHYDDYYSFFHQILTGYYQEIFGIFFGEKIQILETLTDRFCENQKSESCWSYRKRTIWRLVTSLVKNDRYLDTTYFINK